MGATHRTGKADGPRPSVFDAAVWRLIARLTGSDVLVSTAELVGPRRRVKVGEVLGLADKGVDRMLVSAARMERTWLAAAQVVDRLRLTEVSGKGHAGGNRAK